MFKGTWLIVFVMTMCIEFSVDQMKKCQMPWMDLDIDKVHTVWLHIVDLR